MIRMIAELWSMCTYGLLRGGGPTVRTVRLAVVCLAMVSALMARQDQGGTVSHPANMVASAAPLNAQPLRIPKVTRAPKLSDFLEGNPREAEAVVTEFFQMDPNDGAPASQETTAYMSYDDKNLYVGWICKDDPAKIRARVAKRKDIVNDDRITINIDTFHDHKHAYFFDVNPYGVQLDGRTTEGQGDDFSWEALWYSEGQLTEDGYVVLETIPFRSLRFPPGPVQDWGFVLARFIARNNEWSMSPAITRRLFPAWVGQFGHMQIPENVSPGRNMQFIPYGLFSSSRYLDNTNGFRTENDGRAGLDAKMVLRDAFTLDMTLNPDFSQIESDEPQVTVNQRYEVVYPEKRPFFMENASLFKTQQQLFFSRRIVDPQFGIKLTGTVGRWSLGVLASDDRGPGELVAMDDPLRGERAKDQIIRVERGFGSQSHIGALVTNYDFGNSYNRVGAIDTRIELTKHWMLKGQATSSVTRYRDGSYGAGPAYNVSIDNSGQHFNFSSGFADRSPGFKAELGYIPRVDIRDWDNWFSYKWRPKNRGIVSFGPEFSQSVAWNHAGQLQDWSVTPHFTMEFLRLTNLLVLRNESYELFQNVGFRQSMTELQFTSEPFKWLAFNTDFQRGDGINYYPGNSLPPFLGHATSASAGFTLRPQPKLKIDHSYLYTRLGADRDWLPDSVPAATASSANAIFNNHILRTKANYQFTRSLSVRAILDYNGVLPNQSLVSLDNSKRFGTDVLLTYFVHPGTAFYVGYSNALENLAWDPLPSPTVRRTSGLDTLTGRQFFVKMSYLFRY